MLWCINAMQNWVCLVTFYSGLRCEPPVAIGGVWQVVLEGSDAGLAIGGIWQGVLEGVMLNPPSLFEVWRDIQAWQGPSGREECNRLQGCETFVRFPQGKRIRQPWTERFNAVGIADSMSLDVPRGTTVGVAQRDR